MPKRMQDLPEEYRLYRETLARQIGERVRARRQELSLTQDQVRARMELEQVAISRAEYSRLESGASAPDAAELVALRLALNVTLDWLLLGLGQPRPPR